MSLSKTNIPIAAQKKTKLDLSSDHITSMSFMTSQPVFYRHMIKGEHLNFDCLATIRPAPIELPIYGRMRMNLRGFFVPYALVFPQWHAFYNDTIASNQQYSSQVVTVPTVTSQTLWDLFVDQTLQYPLSFSTSPSLGDFVDNSNSGWKLTKFGRNCLKILESLGYKIIPSSKDSNPLIYNALSLLALARIYIDWYANSQYLNSQEILALEQILAFNDPTSNVVLDVQTLYTLLAMVVVTVYDNESYYNNAWDNPEAPSNGQYTSFTFRDPTGGNAYVDTLSNGTPYMRQSLASDVQIGTTYVHQALKRLTDFQRRHALSGARSIDRVLSQYGIVTDSLKLKRCIYVGSQSIDINIGTIFGTANSENSVNNTQSSVGDYAGTSYGNGKKSWDFTCDDEGVFIVLATIQPVGDIVQGYDRNNLHIDKAQFFVPEFDALGVQVLERGEVFVSDNSTFSSSGASYRNAFAFTGRYGEYKRPKSFVTGDLRLPKFYAGGDEWHLMRLFDDSSFNGSVTNLVHSLAFTRGDDNEQYLRIFQSHDPDFDKFYCFFHFDVGAYSPCRPLFETYEFEEDGQKSVTIDANGPKLN